MEEPSIGGGGRAADDAGCDSREKTSTIIAHIKWITPRCSGGYSIQKEENMRTTRNMSNMSSMSNMRGRGETFRRRGRILILCLLMAGVFNAGMIALDGAGSPSMAADPPCFDDKNRYVDCNNGTVTDTVTGLVWLKKMNCIERAFYNEANKAVAGMKHGDCGLSDHSEPGDWRLPTRKEWETTFERAVALDCTNPSLTDVTGKKCFKEGVKPFPEPADAPKNATSPFEKYPLPYYWAITSDAVHPDAAWVSGFFFGRMYIDGKDNFIYGVWPVRDGQ